MLSIQVLDRNERRLKFQGELVAQLETDVLETSDHLVWLELTAYERKDHGWVVTVIAKKSGDQWEDEVCFFSTHSVETAIEFLYDFDAQSLVPDSESVEHVYYCVADLLAASVHAHETEKLNNLADELDQSPQKWINRIMRFIGA